MKRRAFLAFMGGAAASGPKLAQGIAENVAMGGPGVAPIGVSGGMSPDPDWKARQIARLKAIISGTDPEEKQRDRMQRLWALENAERLHLDTLRSVSAAHKYRMLIEGNSDRARRIRRADAEWDLHRLLTGE